MRFSKFFNFSRAATKVRGALMRRYFGIQDHYLTGAVFAPGEPERVFNVGLLDASGEVLLVARADRANHDKDIPAGHGFEFPIPITWLHEAVAERNIQFKVIETGDLFPREPRTLSQRKLLRTFNISGETARSAQARMKDEVSRLKKSLPQGVIVMVTHDMTRTGAPLILLEITRQMKARHAARIVLLSMKTGGQLADAFQEHCEVVIDGMESALNSAPEESAALLALLRTLSATSQALVNTICSMKLAVVLQKSGFEVISLIHEYPFAFTPEHIKKQFSSSTELIFPCKDVEIAFRRQGQLPRASSSRPTARVTLLPQGCYILEQGPPDPAEVEALRARYREEFYIGPEDRVVFSCGTMDSRKGFDWFGALIRTYVRSSPHGVTTHFIWAGGIADEDLYFHFKHELRESGVIGNFHHLNDLSDCRAAFQLADVFVLCSRIDPFPSVVLEAWANGVPVIGFDRCQGCADLIKETGFGVVVPYLDEKIAARAVDDVLADQELRARVREVGPGYVARRFSYKRYVDTLEARLSGKTAPTARSLPEPPVMLLGFHRSGTSFLAHWLAAEEVEMIPSGQQFDGRAGNPDGHGEDLLFLDFHCNALMSLHGDFMRRWGGDRCIFLPNYGHDWTSMAVEAKELVLSLDIRKSWGWKDPRSMLFLDMWAEVFPNAAKILVVRHPLEIIDSLLRRGTDPLVYEQPLAVFDAYVGYHQQVLKQMEKDRANWCVIQMPFDDTQEAQLRDFLAANTTLGEPRRGVTFEASKFHQPDFGAETFEQFEKLFPEASATYAQLLGNMNLKVRAGEVQPDQVKLEWIEKIFPELVGKRTQRASRLAAASQEIEPLETDEPFTNGDAEVAATLALLPPQSFAMRLRRAAGNRLAGTPNRDKAHGRESAMKDQLRKMKASFAGGPEICWICARSIIAIRRGRNVGGHWGTLRHLMETKDFRDLLLQHLSTRWMKSICDSYADHGTREERATALCLVILVNMTVLAETERFMARDPEVDDERLKKLLLDVPAPTWEGMRLYYVESGDMPRLMFGRLQRILTGKEPFASIGRRIIERIRESGGNMIARLEKMNPRFWPE